MVGLFGLDYNVVYVGLNGLTDEVSETLERTSLVCSPHVFQTERHRDIAEQSECGDKRGRGQVTLFHHYLMVPRVHIEEAKGFTPRGRVDYLVYATKETDPSDTPYRDSYNQHTFSISHSFFVQEWGWLTTRGNRLS
jgi:hypothetical protein